MGTYNFEVDLFHAQHNEVLVEHLTVQHLMDKKKIDCISHHRNNDSQYDIWLEYDEDRVTIECKEDFMCYNTNNIAIELECRGKVSGINVTKADYWAITAHYNQLVKEHRVAVYMVKTDKLRELVQDVNRGRVTVGGDEGSNTKMFVSPRHYIEEIGTKLLDCSETSYGIMLALAGVIEDIGG